MNNTLQASVTASLSFDFRGQQFTPSIRVGLHTMMVKQQTIHHLYDLLGASIGLDAYRHEYDVMVMEEITFSQADGLAADFVHDGQLEFDAFNEAWQQQYILTVIQPIAEKHLGIEDLNQHRDLKQALTESYRAGQQKPALTKRDLPNPSIF